MHYQDSLITGKGSPPCSLACYSNYMVTEKSSYYYYITAMTCISLAYLNVRRALKDIDFEWDDLGEVLGLPHVIILDTFKLTTLIRGSVIWWRS